MSDKKYRSWFHKCLQSCTRRIEHVTRSRIYIARGAGRSEKRSLTYDDVSVKFLRRLDALVDYPEEEMSGPNGDGMSRAGFTAPPIDNYQGTKK